MAELIFAAASSMGPSWLIGIQVVAVAATLLLVGVEARRRGAADVGTSIALVLMALGALRSLVVLRAETLSLVPFVLVLLILRREHNCPSRRGWLLVPLLAIWGNLHGAVLMGAAVIGAYLLFSRMRLRRLETAVLGGFCLLALWFTPAQVHTLSYYLGVLGNEAARRGTDLWARPSLTEPLDVLLMIGATGLVAAALRRRLPLWEYVALVGLALSTMSAARHAVWLSLFAAAAAATNMGAVKASGRTGRRIGRAADDGPWSARLVMALVVGLGAGLIVGTRGATVDPVDSDLVSAVAARAGTDVVLAPEPLVESLAVAGVRVWVSNPIDAFQPRDQAAYLDFLQGLPGGHRAMDNADLVVVQDATPSAHLVGGDTRWLLVTTLGSWRVFVRN